MSNKPSIPKGTRDFGPQEVVKRDYIFDVIRQAFTRFGFLPIETPSFENSDTLMGKYGEEGDRLIFKILNSGDYFKDLKKNVESLAELFDGFRRYLDNLINQRNSKTRIPTDDRVEGWVQGEFNQKILIRFVKENKEFIDTWLGASGENVDESIIQSGIRFKIFQKFFEFIAENIIYDSKSSVPFISEKALRYDLTVPFARFVVQHQNEISFPFKRYQIQPVWRADRPQKGRFREFYQCDADVVGSQSLWQEVEFVQLYDTVFTNLRLRNTTIKLNNRKILSGIAEVIGAEEKLIDFTVALDKLDKIGEEKVKEEMRSKGISEEAIKKVEPLFSVSGTASEKIESLKNLLSTSDIGMKGIEELEFIVNSIDDLGLKSAQLEIDVTLARGLNYYTGAIFEVAAPPNVDMGSIGGGGRYDDLTGIFGLKDMSGVGISFGLDRIYLVMEELGLFPETVLETTRAMFVNFGEKEAMYALRSMNALREEGIAVDLYPESAKMGKQMSYADKRGIPYVILAGESEINSKTYTLKNMRTGEQKTLDIDRLVSELK